MYKISVLLLTVMVAMSDGFRISDLLDYLLGGYGNYPSGPGYYPGGSGYYPGGSGYYPGGSGHYPGGAGYYPGPVGPPGAHPNCPLCDSSVYSYCSHKQAHDACCCGNAGFLPHGCYKTDCKFLHANSCQEHQLITNCCCIDLYKNNQQDQPAPVAVVA